MNRTIITKGKLLGIGLKKNAKMRKGNSSLGYFDLNGKTITPYNLKHYLRITTNITSKARGSCPPSGDPKGSLEVNQTNNLRFKLEERLEALRSNNFKGLPKSVELDTAGIHLSDSSKARGSCPPSKTKSLELPWIVSESKPGSFGTRSSIARHSKTNLKAKSLVPSIPHEIKKEKFQENTWTWLSWSIKNNNLITGRIARSLQRAGICVLIGGFTAFLPYKEYSVRNKIICAKEAELQSFQILNLKRSNLNCVLSKDRVTHKYDRSWKS